MNTLFKFFCMCIVLMTLTACSAIEYRSKGVNEWNGIRVQTVTDTGMLYFKEVDGSATIDFITSLYVGYLRSPRTAWVKEGRHTFKMMYRNGSRQAQGSIWINIEKGKEYIVRMFIEGYRVQFRAFEVGSGKLVGGYTESS